MNPSLQVSQKAKKETLRVFACLRVSDVCLFVCACACVCVWVYVHLCAWLVAGSLGQGEGTGLAPLGPIAYEAFPLLFLRFCACLLCLSVRLFIYACSCHFQCISAILGTKQKNIKHKETHYFRKFAIFQKAKKETLRVFACFVYLMCICVCVCLFVYACVPVDICETVRVAFSRGLEAIG